MKRWKETIKGIGNLDYVTVKDVPMRESKFGDVIEINMKIIEDMVARKIIEMRLPLRGQEVKYLRKTMGLSLAAFAEKLNLTAGAIQKWEKAKNERLHSMNEAVVRALSADFLDINISGKLSELVGIEKSPKTLELLAS